MEWWWYSLPLSKIRQLRPADCVMAGPLVLACAARLPGCLAAVCVAGVGPYGVEGLDFLAGQGEDSTFPSTLCATFCTSHD